MNAVPDKLSNPTRIRSLQRFFLRYSLVIWLLFSLLAGEAKPALARSNLAAQARHTESDATFLMIASQTILEKQAAASRLQHFALASLSGESANTLAAEDTNELDVLLNQLEAECQAALQQAEATLQGTDFCVQSAWIGATCTLESNRLRAIKTRLDARRGASGFMRRFLRRLDPSRINLGKFARFVRSEVLPEAAREIVVSVSAGGNVVVRRLLRHTFLRKVRQQVKLNLAADLSKSGMSAELIARLGLPAPASSLPPTNPEQVQRVNMDEIYEQCGVAAAPKNEPDVQPQGQAAGAKLAVTGNQDTYTGAIHWSYMGADVAPDLFWCEAISPGGFIDLVSLDLQVDPALRGLFGSFNGQVSGKSAAGSEEPRITFKGVILSGEAEPLAEGLWAFEGQAEVQMSYDIYEICIGSQADPGQVLDVVVEETVIANVAGNTRDGACVWWLKRQSNNDIKRDLILYNRATMDGNCPEKYEK